MVFMMDSVAMQPRKLGLLSVVTPVLNEEEIVDALYAEVRRALEGVPFELIVVDDGSTDATPQLLDDIAATDPRVKVLHLSRSWGHQTAITAGMDHAAGDAVVVIDGDLQDPPEVISELVERYEEGYDVVVAVRAERPGEKRWKLGAAKAFYRLLSRLAHVDIERDAGDFRLMSRQVVDALTAMPERNRFIRGLTSWIGLRQTTISYRRNPRYAGEVKYTFRKLTRLALDGLLSFSYVPLRLASLMGLVCAAVAFLCVPLAIVARIAGLYVPGIASVLIVVLLLGGAQLLTLGIIGEYLARIYDEAKHRPLYIVRSRVNLPERERHHGQPEYLER
jgi:polyisoprenyl-phosphate glycosyltransferase